jgi:hypothetical protein
VPPSRPPLLLKQLYVVVDKVTTVVCLDAAGQIKELDEPFHIHCRTGVMPWLPGFVAEQRADANAELRRRPEKTKRKSALGFHGRLPPAPDPGPQLPVRPSVTALGDDSPADRAALMVAALQLQVDPASDEQRAQLKFVLVDRVNAVLRLEPFASLVPDELALVLEILARPDVWLFEHLPQWLQRMVLRAEKNARVTRR